METFVNLKTRSYWNGVWRVAIVILGLWVIFELTRRVYAEHRALQTQDVPAGNFIGGVKIATNFLGCWGAGAVWGNDPDFLDAIQYTPTEYDGDTGGVSYSNIARWARNRNNKFRPTGEYYRYIAIATLPIEQTGASLEQIPGVAFAFNRLSTKYKQTALTCTMPCQGNINQDDWHLITDGAYNYWRPGTSDIAYFCGLLNGQCSSAVSCDSTLFGPMQINPLGASFAVYKTPNII